MSMKNLFNYIAAAAALTLSVSACSDVFAPAESSTEPKEAGTIEIAISNVTDYSFDVTLTPKGKPAYYAYLVDNDEPYDGIDAATLYAVGYESVAQGNVKYGKGTESYTFTVEAEPNTPYTVYAVSSSDEGNVGEVVYKTLTTSDQLDPTLEEFQFQENMVALIFSEPVKAKSKDITAVGYAKLALTKEPVVASAKGEIVSNKDGVVIVKFKDFEVPGTYYTVSYPEGTFTDLVGNPVAALESSFTAELEEDEETGELIPDPEVNEGGVYGLLENKTFELNTEDVPKSIAVFTTPVTVKSEYPIADYNPAAVSAAAASAGGKTTTYAALSAETCGLMAENVLGFIIPEEPARGDFISFTIAEGAVMDIFGNVNAECEIAPMVYSYGYKLEDVLGTYTFNTTSAYASYGYGPYAEPVVIAESDNAEKGNIMLTGVLGESYTPLKIYATFDPDGGTITIKGGQVVTAWNHPLRNEDGTDYQRDADGNIITEARFMVLYLADGSSSYYTDDLGFDMPEPHKLQFWYEDAAFGLLWGRVATQQLAGWFDQLFFTSIEYVEGGTEPEPEPEPDPTPGAFKGYRSEIPSVFQLSEKAYK